MLKGQLALTVGRAREAYELAKMGALRGISIGFEIVKSSWDDTRKMRRIHEIKLWEVSLVTFPAQPLAQVTAIKGAPDPAAPPADVKPVYHFAEAIRNAGRMFR